VAWQLVEAVEGLAGACEQLGVPVVGGNVSLYNEAPTGPIFPTPVVGIVGKLPRASRAGRLGFANEGDSIALVGPFEPSEVGSELSKLRGLPPVGELPGTDVGRIRVAHGAVRSRVRSGAFRSAHDIAEGGVAVALAECAIAGGLGATVDLPKGLDPFGEAPGRGFIVSGPRDSLAGFVVIGEVGGDALAIEGLLDIPVSELRDARESGLREWV
jgi:phosphoribosylformylglycinamidine synthase